MIRFRWCPPIPFLALVILSSHPRAEGEILATYDGGSITGQDVHAWVGDIPHQARTWVEDASAQPYLREKAEELVALTILRTRAADYAACQRDVAAATRHALASTLLEQWLRDQSRPDQRKVADYYGENAAKYLKKREFAFQHVFVAVSDPSDPKQWSQAKEKAEAARERLLTGEDFLQVAAEVEGASDPFYPRGRPITMPVGQINPDIERKILSLEPGEISEPFRTQFGWEIFRLIEDSPEHVPPLHEIRDQVEQDAFIESYRERQAALQAELESEFPLQVFRSALEDIEASDAAVLLVVGDEAFTRAEVKDLLGISSAWSLGVGENAAASLDRMEAYGEELRRCWLAHTLGFASRPETRAALRRTAIRAGGECVLGHMVSERFVEPSEATLRSYFEENRSRYQSPRLRSGWMIMINVAADLATPATQAHFAKLAAKKKVEQALAELARGVAFPEVARKFSDAPGANETGGYFPLAPTHGAIFDAYTHRLKPGEQTGIIERPHNFFILKLERDIPPQPLSFDEAEAKAQEDYAREEKQRLRRQIVTETLKDAGFAIDSAALLSFSRTEQAKELFRSP